MKCTLLIGAVAVLLCPLFATVPAHAQTQWTKGMAYQDSSFTLPPNANGQTGSDNPVGDLKIGCVQNPHQPMGNDSNGGGVVYQPYIFNGPAGGQSQNPLNVQINLGANASGTNSYQATCKVNINSNNNGSIFGAGGTAPPSFNSPPNNFTIQYPNVAVGGQFGAYDPNNPNRYVMPAHLSGDARVNGTSSANCEATIVFSQPY